MIGSSSLFFLLFILLLYCSQISNCLSFDDQLDDILKENLRKFDVKDYIEKNRVRRSEKPGIHFEHKTRQEADLPICQNMKGILGGQNAFNYVSLVMAILTLVVNVNNNLNNNNNNLNQFSGNVVGNNNANANSNNNNGNIVNVMPPGKKRKRRKRSLKYNSNSTFCGDRSLNSNLGNASMATLKLIQGIVQYETLDDDSCQANSVCSTIDSVKKMGKIGRIIAKYAKLGWYQMVNPEHGKSFFGRKNCQNNLKNCQKSNLRKKSKPSIRCAVCSHKLVNEEKSEFLNDLASPYAKSVHKLQLFGSDNVTVQEFVNPHNHHFHSVQVTSADMTSLDRDEFIGGDTWFPGFSWKVGYCPICNQPLGWIWRKSDNGNDTGSLGHTGVKFNRTDSLGHTGVQQFYGIRLDKVTDWTNFVFGPLVEVPRLLASFG